MNSSKTTSEQPEGIANEAFALDHEVNEEKGSSLSSVFKRNDRSGGKNVPENVSTVNNVDAKIENGNLDYHQRRQWFCLLSFLKRRPEEKDQIAFSEQQTVDNYLSRPNNKSNYWKNASLPLQHETNPLMKMQILGAIICASTQISVGVSSAFTGITLPAMTDPNSDDLILNKSEVPIFSAVVNIGAMIGSLVSCFTMAWVGQRSTFLIFLPIGMASWLILGLAGSFWLLVVARLLEGLCIGVTAPCAYNYTVEFAHKSVRGRLFGSVVLSFQLGILLVYLVGSSTISWRNLGFVCGIIPLAIPSIAFFFLPDSPRWLAYNGRIDEAERAMTFFRGPAYDIAPEMNEILLQVSETSGSMTVRNQFCKLMETSILQRFFILTLLMFASTFTGSWVLVNYAVSVFESANASINSYLSSILIALTRAIGVGFCLILGDRLGRKPFFIIPIIISGVSIALLGLFFYLKEKQYDTSIISCLPLISLAVFHTFSCIAVSILMLQRAELLPNSVRGIGVALIIVVFFLGYFLSSFTYPFMVDSIGSHWTFWIYGSVAFLMAIIAAIFVPETKGKSLEEIEKMVSKKSDS